ncbi:peptide deformylase [Verrucomicrobiota bacterium]
MKYKIETYGASVLREKAMPVERVDDEIRGVASDMVETMYASNGLGLAAEQVGRTEAICVIDDSPARDPNDPEKTGSDPEIAMPLVMINPVIEEMTGEHTSDEGCLSFPEIFVEVTRAWEVTVSYTTLSDSRKTIKAHGLLSRAIQHEVDHLNGVLLVDQMSHIQKIAIAGKLKRLKKSSD